MLERPSAECGFDARRHRFGDVPALVRANAAAWPAVLARADAFSVESLALYFVHDPIHHLRDVDG